MLYWIWYINVYSLKLLCLFVCFFICLFVCLFIVPLENFSLIWIRYHYLWKAANFYICSALMTIEQWGFFSVSHLLWHGRYVYHNNGHIMVISWDPWHSHLLPNVKQVRCHFQFLWLRPVIAGIWTPTPSDCGVNARTHCGFITIIFLDKNVDSKR